jgi:hypothetical protein
MTLLTPPWEVGQYLKDPVDRGEGTNQWNIPKCIDLLLCPDYMNRLGSTGRFHVGFTKRELKNWAKIPANTAQKQGGGVFEGQCAAQIQERSMVDHALTQMDSDLELDSLDLEDGDTKTKSNVGGACFCTTISTEPGSTRRKAVSYFHLNSCGKPHSLQISLPHPYLPTSN